MSGIGHSSCMITRERTREHPRHRHRLNIIPVQTGIWKVPPIGRPTNTGGKKRVSPSRIKLGPIFTQAQMENNQEPSKVCIKPFPLGTEPLVFIDLVISIRALYFPLAHQSDEAFEDLTTYLMIDFRLRNSVRMISATEVGTTEWACDDTIGLGFHWDQSLRIDIRRIYLTLGLSHQLRNPDYSVFLAPDNTPLMRVPMDKVSTGGANSSTSFDQGMDLAALISGNLGVELTWRPYEANNWLATFAKKHDRVRPVTLSHRG